MLEKAIEKGVTDHAKQLGWLSFKFVSVSNVGVPDRIYFRQGVTLLVEFKRQGRTPTRLQQNCINKIRDQNIRVEIIDSMEAGILLFNRITYV